MVKGWIAQANAKRKAAALLSDDWLIDGEYVGQCFECDGNPRLLILFRGDWMCKECSEAIALEESDEEMADRLDTIKAARGEPR